MKGVVNMCFEREERQVFEKAAVWRNLLEGEGKESYQDLHEQSRVLNALANRDPGGQPWPVLERARNVLAAIAEVAESELAQWREAGKDAPEEGEEHSIIARPREAVGVIVDARRQALRDVDAALELVVAAQERATRHVDERAEV